MTEYVEKLFELATTYGHPNLTKFGELVNDEMWWVVTEIVSEQNVGKRIKLMKQFIKVNSSSCSKTSPKGFSGSKCDVGNWIFST